MSAQLERAWIEPCASALVQVATPYSTGTGFLLKSWGVVVTNEQVVHGEPEVIVAHPLLGRQLVPVWYVDEWFDLALLGPPRGYERLSELVVAAASEPRLGERVVAMGHPFGFAFSVAEGRITHLEREAEAAPCIHHDAALAPAYSGGPLFRADGVLIGINTFLESEGGARGFALPVSCLAEILDAYASCYGESAGRCPSCRQLVRARQKTGACCPHCDAAFSLPHELAPYAPEGVAHTLERLIAEAGHDVRLTRRGPKAWEIHQGSARILIRYHEQTGMIHCEAVLCGLPPHARQALYAFLLRANYRLEGLSFSLLDDDILLSLVLFDRYLEIETGRKLLRRLFEQADHFDDVLVAQFGASWKK